MSESTIHQLLLSKWKDDLRGIRYPLSALDGTEVVGPAWSVFVLVLWLVELADDPVAEVGSGGAAIKISF